MKRFINADIVAGEISNAITLNRFAYANGNPVSYTDPFGLSVDKRGTNEPSPSTIYSLVDATLNSSIDIVLEVQKIDIINAPRPNNIGIGQHAKNVAAALDDVATISKYTKTLPYITAGVGVALDVGIGVHENIQENASTKEILWDAGVDLAVSGTNAVIGLGVGMKIGAIVGTLVGPLGTVAGTIIGGAIGIATGVITSYLVDSISSGLRNDLKSLVE